MELGGNQEKKIIKWLDNIIGVPTKELGLLIGETVRRWRVENQLNILKKAIEKCEKLKFPLRTISPKILCPLLETCSLEDDDYMQDKWANLLVNMLDSEKNIQNHVLPFMLSQVSKEELKELEEKYSEIQSLISEFDEEIEELTSKIESPKFHGLSYPDDKDTEVFKERDELEKELLFLEESREETLIIECDLKNFEIGNLIRLGILTVNPKIDDKKLTINSFGHSFSDLGVLFLNACINTERPE